MGPSHKTVIRKDAYTPVFTEALFTTAKTWKQPKRSATDQRIRRCGTYIQWNTTQPPKGETMPSAATWVTLEIITPNE